MHKKFSSDKVKILPHLSDKNLFLNKNKFITIDKNKKSISFDSITHKKKYLKQISRSNKINSNKLIIKNHFY